MSLSKDNYIKINEKYSIKLDNSNFPKLSIFNTTEFINLHKDKSLQITHFFDKEILKNQ